ncbi:MAG: hypothetical protein U1E56_12450 [Bauldia sp.]
MAIMPTSYSHTPGALLALPGMRTELDSLHRQLATGQRADNYADLGMARSVSLALRRAQDSVGAFRDTVSMVTGRLQVMDATLGRMSALRKETANSLGGLPFEVDVNGASGDQRIARGALEEMIAHLNSDYANRALFAGRAVDQKAVADLATILDGAPGLAGLRQVTDERRQADLGDGLGRLILDPVAADTVTLRQEGAGLPFGFTLSAVSSTLNGAAVTGPSGAPPALSVALTTQPQSGQTVTLQLGLPDGTSTELVLTAGAQGDFALGATVTDTANNLRAALQAKLTDAGLNQLTAASASQAAQEFFASGPPATAMRVDGPPFDTATALIAATPADTVSWYVGDNGGGNPRDTAVARLDEGVTVGYGMRANEQPFAEMMAGLAALVADDFSAATAQDQLRAESLIVRTKDLLHRGGLGLEAVQADIAAGAKAAAEAGERHQTTATMLGGLLEANEGADTAEVSTKLLTLQTRLEASYQATALVLQVSLADYLR